MRKFLDFILYPKNFYKKLNDKTKYLLWGILLIGLIDMILYGIDQDVYLYFSERTVGYLLINLFILIASVVIIGFIDVFFVVYLLSDLFYRFSNRKDRQKKESVRIIFMKVYICSHFIVAPVSAIISVIFQNLTPSGPRGEILLYVLIEYAILFWSNSILTRGAKVIYGYEKSHTPLVFFVFFFWNTVVVGRVLYFIIDAGVFGMLR